MFVYLSYTIYLLGLITLGFLTYHVIRGNVKDDKEAIQRDEQSRTDLKQEELSWMIVPQYALDLKYVDIALAKSSYQQAFYDDPAWGDGDTC